MTEKAPERIWAFYAPEIEEDNPMCDIVAGDCELPYGEQYIRADIHTPSPPSETPLPKRSRG